MASQSRARRLYNNDARKGKGGLVLRIIASAGVLVLGSSAYAAESLEALSRTHGYVYVIVPDRRSPRDALPVTLQAVDDKKEFALVARADSGLDAYGVWVPEGNYVLAAARGYDMPSAKGRDDAGYPVIRVVARRVTDLGTLLEIPVGERQIVMLPIRPAEYGGRVRDAMQEFRGNLSSEEPIEWAADALPHSLVPPTADPGLGIVAYLIERYVERAEQAPAAAGLRNAGAIENFLALAKRNAPPVTREGVSDHEGRLFFGADLGQIRVRSQEGAWSTLDTGTISPITAVMWDNGTLYAGSGDGILRESSDGGAHWTRVASVYPGERIVAIAHAGARWVVASTNKTVAHYARAADVLKIYMADQRVADLQLAKQMPIQPWASDFVTPHAETGNGAYYINALPKLLRFDLKTLQWSTSSPSGDILGFSVADPTGVVTTYMPRGVFSKLFLSFDGGDTWQQRPAPPLEVHDVYFDSKDSGTALRHVLFGGGGVWEVMRYDSQKSQWQKVEDWPKDCVRFLHDPNRQHLFCLTRGGAIQSMSGGQPRTEFSAD